MCRVATQYTQSRKTRGPSQSPEIWWMTVGWADAYDDEATRTTVTMTRRKRLVLWRVHRRERALEAG